MWYRGEGGKWIPVVAHAVWFAITTNGSKEIHPVLPAWRVISLKYPCNILNLKSFDCQSGLDVFTFHLMLQCANTEPEWSDLFLPSCGASFLLLFHFHYDILIHPANNAQHC